MLMGGMTLGLREGVIGLIVLLALYMLFVLLRMQHLRRRRAAVPPASLPSEPATQVPVHVPAMPEVDAPADPWQEMPDSLPEESLHQGLQQEIIQLRDEVDAIRGELAALREDMHQELAHLQSAQSVSPIYGDAMQLAAAGYEPAMIAERCGIARAEAELVVALAKSQER